MALIRLIRDTDVLAQAEEDTEAGEETIMVETEMGERRGWREMRHSQSEGSGRTHRQEEERGRMGRELRNQGEAADSRQRQRGGVDKREDGGRKMCTSWELAVQVLRT